MPPHESHRTVVTVLASAIAVLASAAGTSVFVVGSLTASPAGTVPVAPVIRLPALAAPAPAAPAPAAPVIAARAPARPPAPVAVRSVASAVPLTARPPALLAPARPPAQAAPAPAVVPTASAAATPTVAAAPLTALPPASAVRVIVQDPVVAVRALAAAAAAAPELAAKVAHPAIPVPPVSGWRLAKVAGPKDLDLAVPAPLLRNVAEEATELAAYERSHSAPLPAPLVRPEAKPATTVAPGPIGPSRTAHGDGNRLVQGDGLNGPSAHH